MLRLSIEPVGLQEIQVGVNGAEIVDGWYVVDVDLHTQQVTLLPTSIEGLSIPPALLFTKDQKQEIMMVVTATESKSSM